MTPGLAMVTAAWLVALWALHRAEQRERAAREACGHLRQTLAATQANHRRFRAGVAVSTSAQVERLWSLATYWVDRARRAEDRVA